MKSVNIQYPVLILLMMFLSVSCNSNDHAKQTIMYTCPMPTDSFFSDKPGKCPKCGMELVLMPDGHTHDSTIKNTVSQRKAYTCPMHPQVQSDTAGHCPICGMELEKIESPLNSKAVSLNTLIKPANQQVIANVPMIHMMAREENIEMGTYGFVAYDTRRVGAIATNFSGRIEKLYVRYRYQSVSKGQRIMDLYSPEMVTAEENLLFLLKNDPENKLLIDAAKQKLYLLGMGKEQLDELVRKRKPFYSIPIFSKYSGHVHESNLGMNNNQPPVMASPATIEELSIKEGMYVQKGQNIFSVFDPNKAWVLLNIFADQTGMIKLGNKVRIMPESSSIQNFDASINYIEPVFRNGAKTITARVYFDNSSFKIPIGSQVKATIFAGNRSANWLPEEAVLSLGLDKVVFVRMGESFKARKINTGIVNKHLVQVLSGLDKTEAVAANAQYLVDSESFIKTN